MIACAPAGVRTHMHVHACVRVCMGHMCGFACHASVAKQLASRWCTRSRLCRCVYSYVHRHVCRHMYGPTRHGVQDGKLARPASTHGVAWRGVGTQHKRPAATSSSFNEAGPLRRNRSSDCSSCACVRGVIACMRPCMCACMCVRICACVLACMQGSRRTQNGQRCHAKRGSGLYTCLCRMSVWCRGSAANERQ